MTAANPLRDPQDRRLPRIAGPCGMVLFGVTGDLSRKKVMPAIYDLANRGLLPPGFSLVGFALPLDASATGRIFTAFLPEAERRAFAGTFAAPSAPALLRRIVQEARTRRLAWVPWL